MCVCVTAHTHAHAHAHAPRSMMIGLLMWRSSYTCARAHTHMHTHTCTYTYAHTCMHTSMHDDGISVVEKLEGAQEVDGPEGSRLAFRVQGLELVN